MSACLRETGHDEAELGRVEDTVSAFRIGRRESEKNVMGLGYYIYKCIHTNIQTGGG